MSKYIESEFNFGQIIASLETEIEDAGSVDSNEKPKQDERNVALSDMLQTVFNDLG